MMSIRETCRENMQALAAQHGLIEADVTVRAKALTPEEAIGVPGRRDFPILEGRERVIEATVRGSRGQAFTDSPSDFEGSFRDVVDLLLDTNRRRAIFLAAVNAALAHLGMVKGTVHCRDDAPETCGFDMAMSARMLDAQTIGLVGYNPAIAQALVREYGTEAVRITDLNPQNIGADKFGITIWDGRTRTGELVKRCDLILVTGTTLVNGTFDEILQQVRDAYKRLVVFGITGAGVCHLMGLDRWCFHAQEG